MKPVAYIFGPYTGETRKEQAFHIEQATETGKQAVLIGFAVYIPHANGAWWDDDPRFTGTPGYELMMECCLEYVRRSDVLIAIPGWEDSPGANREKAEAERLGIPICYSLKEARAWYKKWAEKVKKGE